MKSVICTLFEGNYHFGLAALVNSLYQQGFHGDIYAGYRGNLPLWAKNSKVNEGLSWPGATTVHMNDKVNLHFLPLSTDYHFTNYKPDFMLALWDGPARSAENIFYLDPDIVASVKWNQFETWVSGGVALCEDVNSPLSENHPKRLAWRKYYKAHNICLKFKEDLYVNGGFVGVNLTHRPFLEIWQNLQELMAEEIGGLNRSSLAGTQISDDAKADFAPFGKTDQDALNATVEAFQGPVSIVGKQAMGFAPGWPVLPHALGQPKPWAASILSKSFGGYPPRQIDKQYWEYANGPILSVSGSIVYRKKLALRVAAFISRFYRRN